MNKATNKKSVAIKRAEDAYLTEWAWLKDWPASEFGTFNPAVQIGIFWSGGTNFIDRSIQRVTGGPASHIGLVFVLKNGDVIYYEAHWKTNFSGPKDYKKLLQFYDDNHSRFLRVEWTTICGDEAEIIRQRAHALVGTLAYGRWQLLQHWFFERVTRPIGIGMRRSPDQVTCGDIVARLLFPCIDLRDAERRSFDSVNPNSALRRWLKVKALGNFRCGRDLNTKIQRTRR